MMGRRAAVGAGDACCCGGVVVSRAPQRNAIFPSNPRQPSGLLDSAPIAAQGSSISRSAAKPRKPNKRAKTTRAQIAANFRVGNTKRRMIFSYHFAEFLEGRGSWNPPRQTPEKQKAPEFPGPSYAMNGGR